MSHLIQHGVALHNLATALKTRFDQRGDSKDLEEAIELHREALALHVPPHPHRGGSLNDLANALETRFEQKKKLNDIDEAIELHREALALRVPPHPSRCVSLNNLAGVLETRFEQQGDSNDLDKAIELHREALSLRLPPHSARGSSLNNLASALQTRFEQRWDSKDIDEAIELHREALILHSPPHPAWSISLNNLADGLHTRFKLRGNPKDIAEAIQLHRDALAVRPAPHPDRGMTLNNLGNAVKTRFEWQGDSKDIDEAIELHREALALRCPPHPARGKSLHNLANAVKTKFDREGHLGNISLNEAIQLFREVLTIHRPPHPQRGSSLHALGVCLASMYKHTCNNEELDQACILLQEAAAYLTSLPFTRFRHARAWASIASSNDHTSSLKAYHAAIQLLPRLAALHLNLPSRQELQYSAHGTTLASDAAAYTVKLGQYNTAVEFLEASRSIFWSQALQLRTPLDALATIRPELSARLKDIAMQLERASFRDTSWNALIEPQQKIISLESEGAHCRALNEEWDEVIESCRLLRGFGDFMLPKSISALKKAASFGPVITLATTKSTCFALITTSSDDVRYLELPGLFLERVNFLTTLSRGLSNPEFDLNTFLTSRKHGNGSNRSQLETRLIAGREGYIDVDPNEAFRELLGDLWKNVVKPVLDALNLKKTLRPQRLWWCPTGSLTFLPLHAAGIYGPNLTDCTSDYVISSYTPTLTALLDPPIDNATGVQMMAVIQPQTENHSPLPGAREELKKITQVVPNQWLTALGDATPATVQSVLVHLRKSSIMHFACHGTQDLEHPLDSGLILSDGRLKVSQIMQQVEGDFTSNAKKPMSLAFLSACETAKGDTAAPDESMHLATTLLFAGFSGVVGTMWAMNDLDGPKIAEKFYEHLFKNCDPDSNPLVLPDLSQAARALHLAVGKLREEPDLPFSRWVPFIHYGL
ncbi:CHAT domain-containing protein [Mycena galopus ATCC 62051]|nr:CHAT domain-containing protein [Mycena galopus ATCC 62051]